MACRILSTHLSLQKASARQKDDAVNAAVGGLITGVVPGIVTRSVKAGVITGVAAAALMSSTHFW
jgi:hypothetical protein